MGKDVKHIKEGDRVGVGAQSGACLKCDDCKAGRENYCPNGTNTYGSLWPNDKGKAMGGYATYNRYF